MPSQFILCVGGTGCGKTTFFKEFIYWFKPRISERIGLIFLEEEVKIGIDLIQKRVAEYFNIRLSDLKGRKRNRAVAYPRQVAMYLARELTDYSLPELGELFGGRDHTTVLHAYEKIQNGLKNNKSVKDLINRLVVEMKV